MVKRVKRLRRFYHRLKQTVMSTDVASVPIDIFVALFVCVKMCDTYHIFLRKGLPEGIL